MLRACGAPLQRVNGDGVAYWSTCHAMKICQPQLCHLLGASRLGRRRQVKQPSAVLVERFSLERLGENVSALVRRVDMLDVHWLPSKPSSRTLKYRRSTCRERWHDLRSRDSSTAPELSTSSSVASGCGSPISESSPRKCTSSTAHAEAVMISASVEESAMHADVRIPPLLPSLSKGARGGKPKSASMLRMTGSHR